MAAVVMVLACLCSPAAFGQTGSTQVTDPSQIGQALTQPAYTAILDGLTPAQIDAALAYRPDPQVSARLRETLGASGGSLLRSVLQEPAFVKASQDAFGQMVGSHGYSSHNVADAAATLLWFDWQLVHGATLSAEQIHGIHRQVRALFMASPELRALPFASRQTLAESVLHGGIAGRGVEAVTGTLWPTSTSPSSSSPATLKRTPSGVSTISNRTTIPAFLRTPTRASRTTRTMPTVTGCAPSIT